MKHSYNSNITNIEKLRHLTNMGSVGNARGFTIVELLIVIVVIGILAAIVIVAYNGVTQRANTATAQSSAEAVIKRMEAYNTEVGGYPAYSGLLTGASASKTYYSSGVSYSDPTGTTAPTTVPATNNTVNFYSCPAGAAVSYWKYDGTPGWVAMYTGGASSLASCTFKKASATS